MNPIQGKDFYGEDVLASFDKLIAKMEQTANVYEVSQSRIREEAKRLETQMKSGNQAAAVQIDQQEKSAKQVDRLAKEYIKLEQAQSDVNREIIRLRLERSKANQLMKAEARLARSAEGSYDALSAQYTINKIKLNAMTKEMREGTKEGRQFEAQTRGIYDEMKRLQAQTGKTSLNVGNYAQAIKEALGSSQGSIGNLASFGGSGIPLRGAGFAALAAGAVAATDAVIDLSQEFFNLQGQVQTVTSLTGEAAKQVTSDILAVSSTFGASSNEVLISANALSKQLGITVESAMSRIEDGFIAGLDLNGEFLDSLREYPTFFRDIFGQGEQAANALFETIQRGVEQGIYSDKAVDAVKEAGISLRELTSSTRDAIEGIGLNVSDIEDLIGSEGIGAALQVIIRQMKTVERDSPAIGAAIADIFRGAGEDAGLDFLLTLDNINDATRDLIDTENEYQLQQQRLLESNRQITDAQGRLAESIGGTGASLEELTNKGLAFLLNFAAGAIEKLSQLWGWFTDVAESAGRFFDRIAESSVVQFLGRMGRAITGVNVPMQQNKELTELYNKALNGTQQEARAARRELYEMAENLGPAAEQFKAALRSMGIEQESNIEKLGNMGRFNRQAAEELRNLTNEMETTTTQSRTMGRAMSDTNEEAQRFAEGTVGFLRQQLSNLNRELESSQPEEYRRILQEIAATEQQLSSLQRLADALAHIERMKQIALEDSDLGILDRDLFFNNSSESEIAIEVIPIVPLTDDWKERYKNEIQEAFGPDGNLQINLPTNESEEEPTDIFSLLGFDISDEKKEGIASTVDFVKSQFLEMAALRTQLANQRVEEATEEVRQAEFALENELRREEAGLANRVQSRRQDLENAKENQDKALQERRRAQRAEQRINTIQQAGNLVAASAKIWGQLGFPFAIPAIAAMFASFAAAKIRAAKLSRQNLSKGIYRVLGGGKHGSGRDTFVGQDNGTDMYAEAGEGLAVVPESAAKMYRREMPQLFEAIRGGRLQAWIDSNASQNREATIRYMLPQNNFDTSRMENSLSEMSGKMDRRTYQLSDGTVVVQQGNLTTYYRA